MHGHNIILFFLYPMLSPVLSGIPGPDALRPEIDLAGGPSLLETYLNSAFTIFRGVTLANLPPGSPIQMAHSALTALGWHAHFLRYVLSEAHTYESITEVHTHHGISEVHTS
jgi:hypothetical protein